VVLYIKIFATRRARARARARTHTHTHTHTHVALYVLLIDYLIYYSPGAGRGDRGCRR
jgi:hypothetical protein